ncbi:MAG: TonB-dependent receptor [Paludibacteraceae bacterium]|nr:TonB-dependent receptor [Paludibacteraceae bacterium]
MKHKFPKVSAHKSILTLPLLFHTIIAWGGQLTGRVTSSEDGMPLPMASVEVSNRSDLGTDTDDDGYYSLDIPDGTYTFKCEYTGYKKSVKTININGKTKMNWSLTSDVEELGAIEISGRMQHVTTEETQMSVTHLEVEDIKKMPALFGEQDVIKSLQLMPGVKSESDASSGFEVRGGEASQNLVLIDGATINNAGHIMGFFSTFNSDILKDVTLYKGQMPAQYGGRIASVLDINTINGDYQNYKADGAIGLLASKLAIQGPIQKGKSSFYISGRRTYLDLFLKATDDYKNTTLYFYDMNAKVDFKLGRKDLLEVSAFKGNDKVGIAKLMNMEWGSDIITGKWRHQFDEDMTLTSELIHSSYKNDNYADIMDSHYLLKGKNAQSTLRERFEWKVDSSVVLNLGLQTNYHDVITGQWSFDARKEKEERYAWENNFWANSEWDVNKRISILFGSRFTAFSLLGGSPYYNIDEEGNIVNTTDYAKGEIVKTYWNMEPRASVNYKLNSDHSLKAAYSHTLQNIHTVKSGITTMPMDRYTLSTNLIKPETADQISFGYAGQIEDEQGHKNAFEFTAEVYYKWVKNIIDYRDGISAFNEIEMDQLVLAGQGTSYGLETSIKKNYGVVTGWISYTLSKTETQIDGINDNQWYTASNDRRHAVSIVAIYTPNKKWDFSASWTYNSGQAMNLPVAKYEINEKTYYYYDSRNNYRAPSYHRLDLSATKHCREHKHWQGEWSFGLYNAYGRYNPFMINIEEDKTSITGSKITQTSLFSFVPSIAYRFKIK